MNTLAKELDARRYRWLRQRKVLAWERTMSGKARFPASFLAALDECIDKEIAAEGIASKSTKRHDE